MTFLDHAKFLGITIASKFSWKSYIAYLEKKLASAVYIVHCIGLKSIGGEISEIMTYYALFGA